MYLFLNHIRNPTSQYNLLDKLLITRIMNTLKTSHHNINISKVRAHTNIVETMRLINWPNEERTTYIVETPSRLIGHWTPYWPFIPPTSMQHDLKNYIEKEYVSALISHAKNTKPYIDNGSPTQRYT